MKIAGEEIINPHFKIIDMSDDDEPKEDLIDWRTHHVHEMHLQSKSLLEYWCSRMNMFT